MNEAYARLEWLLEDRNRIWLHILFWIFIYLDELLGILGITKESESSVILVLSLFMLDALTVYFNLYLLIGTYLIRGKLWMYLAFTAITLFLNIEFSFLLRYSFFDNDLGTLPDISVVSQLISDFAYTTFMLGTAIGAHMLIRNVRNQKRIRMLETEKLSTELKFLKNQINPHFLFNSLNNIYVLTRKRPEEASETVLLLSDLLRYQLYECAQDKVLLKNEIQYVKNYLKLERLRRSGADIQFQYTGKKPDLIEIAPFIFIPFVENAVKHGSVIEHNVFIDIHFQLKPDDTLFFRIENSLSPGKATSDSSAGKKEGGIGLTNVKRRLELIYPARYQLDLRKTQESYIVELSIKLKK
ncbi:MAG: GHKL domain-containing protein [Bacteroidetes bacterium]|jgi:sensor histidine kinase YesM|nr:GHKL domain-containing protein [Bacteroidota bacterium]